ncbi:6-phosphogluconate dehydrogenase C-terminal domain-like protein, partial [Hortaea werneckii]
LGDKAKTAVDMAKGLDIQRIAMIGCGSMGGGMAQLFAEKGIFVGLQDPNESIMDRVLDSAAKAGIAKDRIKKYNDYESLCKDLSSPKVFVWSLPHGGVGDKVLDGLMPLLEKGDIIIDCGNEHWENTERRQGKCVTKGIRYVGCGVSGGYQAARRGPSMCPGADDETLSLVLPTLRKVAAKDPDGKACVGRVGTGGAGHYCKMIHNGIEHGMMSAISEAYAFMRIGLGMSLDEVADIYDQWNSDGELKGTFLVWISRDICRKTNSKGQRVLDEVEDKVVQDFTGEEGTGIWSNIEAVDKHVPAPTLTTAHYLRLASGNRYQRAFIQKAFGVGDGLPNDTHTQLFPPQKLQDVSDRATVLEDLRKAVYAACLSA